MLHISVAQILHTRDMAIQSIYACQLKVIAATLIIKIANDIIIGRFPMKTEIRVVLSCLVNLKVLLSILNPTG